MASASVAEVLLMNGLTTDFQYVGYRLPAPALAPCVSHVDILESICEDPEGSDRNQSLGGIDAAGRARKVGTWVWRFVHVSSKHDT